MKDRDIVGWEELARHEPYFAVLTNEGRDGVPSTATATAAFFETGEDDIEALLAAIASVLGHSLRMACALDFGCGAGRLTLPLARRALRVVGCDVAPTMLAHARRNAESAGVHNTTFIRTEDLAGLAPGEFDFICSLLVFQYIPTGVGHQIMRTLLDLLAPGGVAAIQITFRGPNSPLRRLARLVRARSRRRRKANPAYLEINEYDANAMQRDIEAAGAHVLVRLPTRHGNRQNGAVLIIAKPLSNATPA